MVRNFKLAHYWSWLFVISVIFVPIIIIFLLFSEVNLAHNNYIIAKNSPTPALMLPINNSDLASKFQQWLSDEIPKQYHCYFTSKLNDGYWIDSKNIAYYLNNQLQVHNQAATDVWPIYFPYPQSTASIMPLVYGLITLSGQLLFLAIYFGCFKWLSWRPKLNFGESLAFLMAIWTGFFVLIYSGAIPIFWGNKPYAWHMLLIRLGLIIISSSLSFMIGFHCQKLLYKSFYSYDSQLGLKRLMTSKNNHDPNGKKPQNTITVKLKK